ncbi:MAG: Hpt domain-containing protein [Pseudomonadota bacterium]
MSDAMQQAYLVVSEELDKTLNQARVALEDAVEGRSTRQAIERCGELLHEIGGVLKVVEVYGGALLAEEMEHVCVFMLEPGRNKSTLSECLDALTRAMVQLPAYLERMLAGGRDVALVLLPMLNDLRAVRGQPLLSESTILLINRNLSDDVTVSQRGSEPSEDFVSLSRKVRPAFQLALLGLLKADDKSATKHLQKLHRMALAFGQAANRDDVYRLWWVVGGVLETLIDGSLPISVSVKRLLGQADRRIKRVIDAGLETFDKEPVTDLVNSLLFYIARAENPSERVLAIRDAFGLSDPLPSPSEVEDVHGAMAGPSVALMQTVAAAIREDLAAVKDVLDIHVRTGERDLAKLTPQIDLLTKISDTLGVLGLGDQRANVLGEVERLQNLIKAHPDGTDPNTLLTIASTLLSVESSLERRLTQMVKPAAPKTEDDARDDLGDVRPAVMRECIVNLARIKDTLTQTMSGKVDRAAIDAVPVLVNGITSGLAILELERANAVFARLGAFFKVYLNAANHTLASDHQDRLADALVSIEYYMETIEAGRKQPEYMLDNAETCLSVLDEVRRNLAMQNADTENYESTQITRGPVDVEASDNGVIADSTKVIQSPVVSNDTSQIDPELLELFIEEAKEDVRTIKRLLPKWHSDTSDMDSLITVRRSFHTLKGSGRMVGAERIGEYCWHIEDLLNRVINRTLQLNPSMTTFVAEAADAVPELIEQLEVGIEPKTDVDLLSARARAFAEGDPNAAMLTRESTIQSRPALEMDPTLYEVFAKEANGYLATIGAFVSSVTGYPADVTEELHRACHTLHGSINAAGLDRAAPLSGALNQLARRVFDGKGGLDHDAVRLVAEAAKTVDSIVHAINEPNATPLPVEPLVSQLEAKTASLAHEQSTLLSVEDGVEAIAYEPTEVLQAPHIDGVPASQIDGTQVFAEFELSTDDDYDPEIAEIFTEEAAEILESADAALTQWQGSRDQESLSELKRFLHTLKGSANMAGIKAFGKLSHELEALLIALDDQRVDADGVIDALLRQSFDTLHQMREIVVQGHQPSAMSELEGTVRLAALGEMPVEAAAPAEPEPVRGFSDDEMIHIPDTTTTDDIVVDEVVETGVIDSGAIDLDAVFGAAGVDDEDLPEDTAIIDAGSRAPSAPFAMDESDSQNTDTLFGPHTETQEISRGETPLDLDLAGFENLDDTAIGTGPDLTDLSFDLTDDVADDPTDAKSTDTSGVDPMLSGSDETQVLIDDPSSDNVIPFSQDGKSEDAANSGFDDDAIDVSDTLIEKSNMLERLIEDAANRFAERAEDDTHAATIATDDVTDISKVADDAEYEQLDDAADALTEAASQDVAEVTGAAVVPDEEDAETSPANVAKLVTGGALPARDTAREKVEYARVDSRLLEDMLNAAGEISIYHGRLSQQVSTIDFHLAELAQTVTRLREQLRHMDMETEAQILTRHEDDQANADFDPLELDRYSTIQQLSRALAETSNDVDSLKGLLQSVTSEADTLLTQQSRVTTELQNGLMRTRMVPFDRHVARLERIVRQAASETGKQVTLAVEGASGELDRQVLEKMLPPLEHMMRNAVVHGIEMPSARQAAGKTPGGQITIRLHREGAEMVIDVADDGRGLDADAIRRKGIERNLIAVDEVISDEAVVELILEPGFSTAEQLTQAAGRGVGMDVVDSEVKRLGGSLNIGSLPGQGTNFNIRLPFTLAITQALVVRSGDEVFALPLPTVEGVTRLNRKQIDRVLAGEDAVFEYGEHSYRMRHLGPLVDGANGRLPDDENAAVSVILIRAGQHSTALLVDEMLASREIVVKSVGPQISAITGVSGATILGDGRVVLILDMPSLVRQQQPLTSNRERVEDVAKEPLVMVVDDSITVRRVTERFLLRNDFRVLTARDGLDAVSLIQEQQPDIILLDIEMPRMDGFEFATHVRNDTRFSHTPIIMITSRSGEKHKARAIEIGVNDYLGKPYQDHQLLQAIRHQLDALEKRRRFEGAPL